MESARPEPVAARVIRQSYAACASKAPPDRELNEATYCALLVD